MATGQSTLRQQRLDTIRSIRVNRQLHSFFKWKLFKYQEAEEAYLLEKGSEGAVEICRRNIEAFTKAVITARTRLLELEIKLESL